MKFLQLKIANFLTIGQADPIKLDDRGLVLIQGVNHDDSSATSNGVGKSSIPDALCWALYGVTAREVSGDAVVNKVSKKDCSVQVHLQDGDSFYCITRYRKHKEFKNSTVVEVTGPSEDDSPCSRVDLSKGTEKETQEVINGIMGCSLDVFMAAIYAGQENMPDLPRMTDKQLKLLIEEAAGVERLEGAYLKAREKLSGAKCVLDRHVTDNVRGGLRLVELETSLAESKIAFKSFEDKRGVVRASHASAAEDIKTKMIALVAEIKAMGETALLAEAETLDGQLAENARVVSWERALVEKTTTLDNVLTRAQGIAERAKGDALKVKAMIDNAPEEMKKPCPECGKPHTEDELADYVGAQRTKLKACIEQARRDAEGFETAKHALNDAVRELEQYRSTMPDVSAVALRRREITRQLRGIAESKSELHLLKKDHDTSLERVTNAMTAANPSAAVIEHVERQIADSKKSIAAAQVKIAATSHSVSLYENVVKVFGPAGVRAHILDSVTPYLNERTADYLSAMSDGNISAVWSTLSTTAKGDLKEKFNIEVVNDKGAESFAGLSGGEKRKVRLSTMLALQDLVASRAAKSIQLFVGDEIDDALDVAGLERLMSVLERRAGTSGTVLVISHNDLADWIDNVVTVTKKDGVSLIEGALCS